MRDFALNQAQTRGHFGISLSTLYANWRTRRQTAVLKSCDDRTLGQLGLTHEDVCHVLRLPLTQNTRLALEERAFRRSRGL